MDIAQEILTTFYDDSDLLIKLITGDKSWAYDYDKAQSYRFATIEERKEKSKQELLLITKTAFQKCFDN